MYVRVRDRGTFYAFVVVRSEREGPKIKQRFVCYLGSIPKNSAMHELDHAYLRFLMSMHEAVAMLDLTPAREARLRERIRDKMRN